MFEEVIREMRKLRRPRRIPISLPLDEKGYIDRDCPNSECGDRFKVSFEDWGNKVTDARVFCPFCRHEAPATQWNTSGQEEHIRSVHRHHSQKLVQEALKRGVQRSRPKTIGGGLFNLKLCLGYKPGRIPPVIAAEANEVLRQDFVCERCGCRFASLGASFFCPACGHNSAGSTFDSTLETVEKTVASLPSLEASLTSATDIDTAKNAVRQLLEDQFARLVGAFERINEALFDHLPKASQFPKKGSVFQRLDDASALWGQAVGKSYTDFLSASEFQRMKLLFQRRHVFSHRQGLVDQAYIDRSGDTSYAVGQRLVVRQQDVRDLVALMKKLVAGIRTLV